jgi:hypothetical protein
VTESSTPKTAIIALVTIGLSLSVSAFPGVVAHLRGIGPRR